MTGNLYGIDQFQLQNPHTYRRLVQLHVLQVQQKWTPASSFRTSCSICYVIVFASNSVSDHITKTPNPINEQPLSQIAIEKAVFVLHDLASINAHPLVLGVEGEDTQWVNVDLEYSEPSQNDWVGVFSPAKFNLSNCYDADDYEEQSPYICSAPIKPKLVAVSNIITFANPKAPLYPRLALGKSWDEMTVTWTSGYNLDKAIPFVEWGFHGDLQRRLLAGTLTFHRNSDKP